MMGDERYADFVHERRRSRGLDVPTAPIPGAPKPYRFSGPAYDPHLDRGRLSGQIQRIFEYMRAGAWHTLPEIAAATGDPEASISAQLRHLRKERFGSHTVERRRRGEEAFGLHEYRLMVNEARS